MLGVPSEAFTAVRIRSRRRIHGRDAGCSRDSHGFRPTSPPHTRIIVDNPPLIERRIQILVKDIWGDAHQDFYLAWDTTQRKIEFKKKCDKKHQATPGAERDYSYCLIRFGFPPHESNGWGTKEAEDRLRSATESLFKNRYDLRGDPYSSEYPDNAKEWKQKPTSACYLKTFTRETSARAPDNGNEIHPRFATLLRGFFASGSLKKSSPSR